MEHRFLSSKDWAHTTKLMLLSAAVGFGCVLYLFPIGFLTSSAPWWHDGASQDVKQVVLGMRYFVGDTWHFPIFRTLKITPPDGVIIIYTDCVPLFAFFAK